MVRMAGLPTHSFLYAAILVYGAHGNGQAQSSPGSGNHRRRGYLDRRCRGCRGGPGRIVSGPVSACDALGITLEMGVLGVVLLAVSFLFFKWQPLATEFHVALAAAAFFYAVAGLIAVYGAVVDETKLERVAPAMALGILTEAGILLLRRDKFIDHVLNRIAPATMAPR